MDPGSSTSAWYAPGPSATSTRAVAPRRDWQRRPIEYAAVKAAKYADQDNFRPFILETGGVNKAARDWLDTLTAPEPSVEPADADDH